MRLVSVLLKQILARIHKDANRNNAWKCLEKFWVVKHKVVIIKLLILQLIKVNLTTYCRTTPCCTVINCIFVMKNESMTKKLSL